MNRVQAKIFGMDRHHYLEKSQNKIKAAELLFENGFYNDCISRCYYSMFWAAKALLLIKGLNFVKTHKGVITRDFHEKVKKVIKTIIQEKGK